MVLIKNSQKLRKVDRKAVHAITEKILEKIHAGGRDLSILFVNDKKITEYNRNFFGKDRPTNVISFSYTDGFACEVLGDIVISLETAEEEAKRSGTGFYERLFGLIIHGLLHIIGYDHEGAVNERRRMQARERRLLAFVKGLEEYQGLAESIR